MCLSSCFMNHLSSIFFILTFIKISNTLGSGSVSDTQNVSCKFTLHNGEVINLLPLISTNQPLIASTSTSLYIYHPCTDASLSSSQPNECSKSYALCYFVPKTPTGKVIDFNKVILNETLGNFSLLAHNAEAVFRELKYPEIVYRHFINDSFTVSSFIQIDCNEKVNYKLNINETSTREHILTLSSKHFCFQTPHYMSGGTVFFIILVVFLALYFIGGVLVLKFIRGATGIEMIPNHEFWCSLPQLFKNGFKYLRNCGKSTPDSYEKI